MIFLVLLVVSGVGVTSAAKRVAIVSVIPTQTATKVTESLSDKMAAQIPVLDRDLATTVFSSLEQERPFNPERDAVRTFGDAAGVEFLILIKSDTLRRFSFEKKDHFESYAAIFLFATRDGEARSFKLLTCSEAVPDKAENCLTAKVSAYADELTATIKDPVLKSGDVRGDFPPPPDPDSPAARSFRAPLPYKRLSPRYTPEAALYGVTATVDVEVDFDHEGRIRSIRIVRWAGFGLDESVTDAVRAMNWRPASIDGKPVPVRALLRYNFKKIEKEDD